MDEVSNCGSLECIPCIDYRNRLLNPRRSRTIKSSVTVKALQRHGKKFGWEMVGETASELGLSITIPREARPKRRQSAQRETLKQRVREYVADGKSVDHIALVEEISRSRARRLVMEVEGEE